MSKISKANAAFDEVMEYYRESKASGGWSGSGSCASLSNSASNSGKVRASASDLIADVTLAASRALRDYPAESKVFQRIYLDGDTPFAGYFAGHIGLDTYSIMEAEMIRRVGEEFINSGIYPIRKYAEMVDVR